MLIPVGRKAQIIKGTIVMGTRKLKVESVTVRNMTGNGKPDRTMVEIEFSRKLTALEVSGVEAVLVGQIK